MGQAAKKTVGSVTMSESLHAGDCAVAAELMDALAACALDQLRELREMMRRKEGSVTYFADIETFDIVSVLIDTVRTQARVVQEASEAIQNLQSASYRQRRADRGGETEA